MMKRPLIAIALGLAVFACKKSNDSAAELKVALVSPSEGSTVTAGTAVQFRWTASSSNKTVPLASKIKIVEILGDESPEQALRTNKPIFEKDSGNWFVATVPTVAASPGFVAGKKYAWSITTSQAGIVSKGEPTAQARFSALAR